MKSLDKLMANKNKTKGMEREAKKLKNAITRLRTERRNFEKALNLIEGKKKIIKPKEVKKEVKNEN